jgi:cytochrome o ubiquinol oxidase operon protein cyoD
MPTSVSRQQVTTRPYLLGVALAVLLTAIPFAVVAARALPLTPTYVVIAATAVVQVVVHLRFFLHLELTPASQDKLIALCFAFVLLFILVGGTLWIMFDLSYRMM